MGASTPPDVWKCPVVNVSGPPLWAEYTALDRPTLLDPF